MVFQEQTYRVLLVSASDQFNTAVMPLLPATDYWPVTTVKSVAEATRRLQDHAYDLILINAPLPDDQGIQLAVDACRRSSAGVLLLLKGEVYHDMGATVASCGVMPLAKPASAQMVAQALRVLCAIRERLRQAEEKKEELRLTNRAKWLLIERVNMTESEAHRYIEKQSMDLRISKRRVAEDIIETYTKSLDR